jgi:mannosyl-3-phosphoglycerate phosphatase family protein
MLVSDMSIATLLERVRGEYLEMPGLRLTLAQAARLWSLDGTMCRRVLETLTHERFLAATAAGTYVRADSLERSRVSGLGRQAAPVQSACSEPAARQIVVFADPDTLWDVRKAAPDETRGILRELAERGVIVVLWGNETRAEMEVIRADLDLRHPFVSESGGGLFVPVGYFPEAPAHARAFVEYDVLEFGRRHAVVAAALHEVANRLRIAVTGFSDMSVEEVATDCRLSLAQARLATLREYDEPFRIADTSPAVQGRLFQALRRAGFRCFTHEAYQHVTGVADKTDSVRALTSLFRRQGDVLTVGLARDPDELGLLQAVDIPVVILSDSASVARLLRKVPTARLTSDYGPVAWGQALRDVVNAA